MFSYLLARPPYFSVAIDALAHSRTYTGNCSLNNWGICTEKQSSTIKSPHWAWSRTSWSTEGVLGNERTVLLNCQLSSIIRQVVQSPSWPTRVCTNDNPLRETDIMETSCCTPSDRRLREPWVVTPEDKLLSKSYTAMFTFPYRLDFFLKSSATSTRLIDHFWKWKCMMEWFTVNNWKETVTCRGMGVLDCTWT